MKAPNSAWLQTLASIVIMPTKQHPKVCASLWLMIGALFTFNVLMVARSMSTIGVFGRDFWPLWAVPCMILWPICRSHKQLSLMPQIIGLPLVCAFLAGTFVPRPAIVGVWALMLNIKEYAFVCHTCESWF